MIGRQEGSVLLALDIGNGSGPPHRHSLSLRYRLAKGFEARQHGYGFLENGPSSIQ